MFELKPLPSHLGRHAHVRYDHFSHETRFGRVGVAADVLDNILQAPPLQCQANDVHAWHAAVSPRP